MIASNIFRWIGTFFTEVLFLPFQWIRTQIATQELGWWISNAVNWGFLLVLLILFGYWMKQSKKFLDEGTEDKA
ncbi:MAG: hypothetical protein GW772_02920 [Flavobacteriia bacterium]|nr:hypothetical protein [Flavobacteriia bacterium]OIP45833.1 MAG: hypothetical protein AUK46_11050 [Flavobacteriaceae bacterium CG2_30_31_66]PIV96397.1 MAG: hypothetical protein COW43_08560 [Flavobacteriaceae bacterium CG17_big_fil_post_rev_8_21_14_2_50_31_13]PIX15144.1 MAG: hypothetical protein COZ74_01150 [Flavobacteriaceae bacterium CG_4_8_14_3_um_filter_31_8]PIY13785.1 MAG: hypothetical protein COZ16_12610 [Flavobacteriaceae bacterium CG_4_10_14_3_um_filter_31_253]PIZ09781.1 MAG: hypotheti